MNHADFKAQVAEILTLADELIDRENVGFPGYYTECPDTLRVIRTTAGYTAELEGHDSRAGDEWLLVRVPWSKAQETEQGALELVRDALQEMLRKAA